MTAWLDTVTGWWQAFATWASHVTDLNHPAGITTLAAATVAAGIGIALEIKERTTP